MVVKGLFKVYYKQQQHVMQSKRKIIDYPQDPSPPQASATSTYRVPPPMPQQLPLTPSVPTTQPSSTQECEQQYLQQQQ